MAAAAAGTLARFQDAFARALRGPLAPMPADIAALAAQPAFAMYRNTVMMGCIDALHANYPAVARLVGDEWFRAAAAVYAGETLPSSPVLAVYGATFPEFLARFEPAAGLPYLPHVARLDRYWTEAHVAAEEAALDPATIAAIAPDELADRVLEPHAAARWAWFAQAPAYTLWSRNRSQDALAAEFDWRPEGALLTRPRDAVVSTAVSAAACAFLDACAAGATLDVAARAALDTDGGTDLARLMQTLLEAGAFSRARTNRQPQARSTHE